MYTTNRVVRILWSELSGSLSNSDVKDVCFLYHISCIFSSPTKGCHKLREREGEGNEVEYVHGSADLDLVEGTGTANEGHLIHPESIPLFVYFGGGFIFSRHKCAYMLVAYWSNSLQ